MTAGKIGNGLVWEEQHASLTTSAPFRAVPYAKRVVRRKTYSKSIGATRRFLKALGLSK
jgi:hypothetical protein